LDAISAASIQRLTGLVVLREEERGIEVIWYGIPDEIEEPSRLLVHIPGVADGLGGQCLKLRVVTIDDLGRLEKGVHRLILSSSV
jgi:hypothetical protein